MASMLRGVTSSLVSRPCALRSQVAFRPVMAPVRAPVAQRGALQVVAAEEKDKKAPKKRTPFPVKRAQLAEERRMYNKARKSACATRIKKVIKLAESLTSTTNAKTEADVKGLETLISEAFCQIDKAVTKGILHKNNAARKKARCSRYKKKVLLAAGLWTPPPEHPDHRAWQKLQPAAAKA